MMFTRAIILVSTVALTLSGCTHHAPDNRKPHAINPDLLPVIASLHDQLHNWRGTPYHYGGTTHKGVDCSGFVWRTLRDQFHIPLDRLTTEQLIHMGKKISPQELQPGDLVFFRIKNELHVGFYDTDHHFIHASVSQGVTRSSMNSPYWKKAFITARRLPRIRKAFSLAGQLR
ncbi:NlpC [Salmonella enterica subsp. enterica serovar Oranienburg]|nr:NlpC [Salmonella enterica subsp. enterica serovar Oranienburg]